MVGVSHLRDGSRDHLERSLRTGEQRLARRVRRRRAFAAIEQWEAEKLFKIADLMANRALGQVEFGGSGGKAAKASDGFENPQCV
ncbi:hypothetical protein ADM96_01385 [Burkholderia sp. ST111]|nr:hypothetical protein ADM96_01385 [Burkholderia sp. ST111]